MSHSSIKIHVGNIIVSLEGSGEMYEGIIGRLAAFRKTEAVLDADIIFRCFPGKLEEDEKRSDCRFRTALLDIAVTQGNPVVISFSGSLPMKDRMIHSLPEHLQRIAYGIGIKRPFSVREVLVEGFFYEIFEGSLHYMMLKKGISYIHASAIRNTIDGEAYIFAGERRSGKSTTMVHLSLHNDHLRPLADDRLMVTNNGTSFFTESFGLLRLSTLLSSDEFKKAFLGNHSRFEGILCELLRVMRCKYAAKRISLLRNSDNTGYPAETTIKVCFYLRRAKTARFNVCKMRADEFACRTSHYIFSKHAVLFDIFDKMGHDEDRCESRDWIREEIEAIHRAAFSDSECYEVNIPENMTPSDLGETMKALITSLKK